MKLFELKSHMGYFCGTNWDRTSDTRIFSPFDNVYILLNVNLLEVFFVSL
ncbi:hypothetical protein LX99_00797 [Mucilaginibacter oryzae]|uniref:Uncharacterized protein n=1 Tax=Mucilaginibacter oryzae TaxID=468058 RepID=A0A316HZ35_9SPHI|nr:hypothetical protein LX99_00797 [Mucilaginibacter oryzae]